LFFAMAPKSLLPALVQERQSLEPLATVSILHTLQPVANRLRSSLEHLSAAEAHALDGLLERTGAAVVFRGHPVAARALEALLRRAGLTTSVNVMAHREATAG